TCYLSREGNGDMEAIRTMSRKFPLDDRAFQYGEIYIVKDEFVNFPESKYTKTRTLHDVRMVCIVHHCESNSNKFVWTVNAAPLSTSLRHKRDTDLEIEPVDGNYINERSLIRLGAA